MIKLTNYQWQQMNKQRLHDDLRNTWALVSEQPGISLRKIGENLDMTHWQVRRLVKLLTKSGTLTQAGGSKCGTLRATIPLITITQGGKSPCVRDTRNNPDVSGT